MGALPVRDFVERGLPLMSAASAAAQLLFGPGLQSELMLVALAYALSAVLLATTTTAVSGSLAIGVSAAVVTVLAFPASYSYPKLLVYAAAFAAAVWYGRGPSFRRLALVAGAVAVAFLFRHDHGFFLMGGTVVMLAAFHGKAAVRPVAMLVLNALLLVSPYLIWVQVHEGLGAYFGDGVEFSRRESERASWWEPPAFAIDRTKPLVERVEGGPVVNVRWVSGMTEPAIVASEQEHDLIRRDPVGPLTWQYELRRWRSSVLERLVRDPAVADTHGIDRGRFRLEVPAPTGLHRLIVGMNVPGDGMRLRSNAVAALFYVCWLMPIVTLLLAWRGDVRDRETLALVLMAAAVQLAMNVSMLRDPLDSRIRDVVTPFAVMLAFAAGAAAAVRGTRQEAFFGKAGAVAIVTGALAVAAALGPLGEHVTETRVLRGLDGLRERYTELHDELAPPRERTGRVSPASERLATYFASCTAPGDRLLAMTFAPELFFYAHRGFAGGHVAMTPGYFVAARHEAGILDRLAREDVPLVIMDSETDREMAVHYPRLVAHVQDGYQEVGRVPVGPGKELILLAARGRTPVRRFADGRLPCYTS